MSETFEMVNPPDEIRVSMKMEAQKTQLGAAEMHGLKGLVSLTASQVDEDGRAPMEIVLVADRSGSMGGDKIRIMRNMMHFLVKRALRTGDKLAIVAFDHEVTVPLRMTTIDAEGKGAAKAREAIQGIDDRGTTNLSGGLLRGISELNATQCPAGTTRAILLFTDGAANGGIQEPPAVAEAITGAMRGRRTKVFTFGFGDDAEEEMLKTIAETTQGQYYHVASDERIAHAFGNCIGGLVSVVAQNVTLTLTHGAHATVAKVHGSYPTTVDPATHTTVVELGDLYGEEKKNLLLDLTLPPLETPVGSEDVVNASLTYFDARENRSVTRTTTLRIARPAETPIDQKVNVEIDEQINRLRLADAMQEATRVGDAGDVAQGHKVVQDAVAAVLLTPSGGAGGHPLTPLIAALVKDARALAQGFQSTAAYIATGAKAAKSASQALHAERSNTQSGEVYQNESQAAFRSLAAAAADEEEEPRYNAGVAGVAAPPLMRSMAGGSPPPAASLRGLAAADDDEEVPRTSLRSLAAAADDGAPSSKRQAVSAMQA